MGSPITTHVLDTTTGRPAAGVAVQLETWHAPDHWHELGSGSTDADGRCATLLTDENEVAPGIYRLTFDIGAYFEASQKETFYTTVPIVFKIAAAQPHLHVPLLVSPFGYSTYRGS